MANINPSTTPHPAANQAASPPHDATTVPLTGPNPTGAVTVTVLADTDPLRLCQRLSTELDSPWHLTEANVTAQRIYPTPAVAVGDTTNVVECTLVRTDGQPPSRSTLPDCLDRFNVIALTHHPAPHAP